MKSRGETTAIVADRREAHAAATWYFFAALASYLGGERDIAKAQIRWANEEARIGLRRPPC